MDKLARSVLGKNALNDVSAKLNTASKPTGSMRKSDTVTGVLDGVPVRNGACLQKSNSMPNLKNSHANESPFRPLSMGSTPNGARPPQSEDGLDALLKRYQALKDSSAHLMSSSMTSEQLDAELRQRLDALRNPTIRRVSSYGSDSSFSTANSSFGSRQSSFGSRRVGYTLSRAKTSIKDLDWYERKQLTYAKYGLILGGSACVGGLAIGITQVVQAATD